MPMPYSNFNWRPNDNGALTNLRYTLEAEKWVRAVHSAQQKAMPGEGLATLGKDLAFVGMVVQLVFCVLLLVLLGLLKLISSLVYLIESNISRPETGSSSRKTSRNTGNEKSAATETSWKRPEVTYKGKEDKPFSFLTVFYDQYGKLRGFWRFLYIAIFVFVVEVVGLYFLGLWFPAYISFGGGLMLAAGVVSLFFAATGME